MIETTTHAEPIVPADPQRWLWLSLLSGPIVYSAYFLAGYLFVEITCTAGFLQFQLLGMSMISIVVVVLTLVALALAVCTGFLAYRRWQELREQEETNIQYSRFTEGPAQFMTFAGVLLNGLFAFTILATGIPALLLRPCDWI